MESPGTLRAGLALVSGILLVLFVVAEPLGIETGPYFGIVVWVVLPTLFAQGLVVTPLGYLRARRRLSAEGAVPGQALPNPRLQ